ncbi:MAG: glycosyltransferase family 2 protein, partial [Candidatus Eremiobacteraeota bacterium]|nr:glycosyltransferase family 2 protein [Candidatus Eremiobacteraeota bacterium]
VVAARDFARLGDVLIVRSFSEYERYRFDFGTRNEFVRWIPRRELGNWEYRGPLARRIVIWAAGRRAETTALFVAALHPLHAELVVVSSGGEAFSERAIYLHEDDPAAREAVSTASCVIDAAISDPSWSHALAARGVPLAYSTLSGAHEWVDGGRAYAPWSSHGILDGACAAIAEGSSRVREPLPDTEVIWAALAAARPKPLREGPLVSIVVATYNRPEELRRNSLRSLLAQQYRNLEIIVVNDGGEKVADVAKLDPRIRVFDREENVGPLETGNFGARQATGKYLQFLADDDALYPDHVARLVEALERTTGYGVAHGDTLIRYERLKDEGWTTIGFNATVFTQATDLEEAMASSTVAGQGLFMRLELVRRLEFFRDLLLADQELQIRLLKETDFLHVPRYTNEWLIRDRGHNISRRATKDVPAGLRAMFDLHPSENSFVVQTRAGTYANISSRAENFTFPPIVASEEFTFAT